jgi:hypothetical protein
VNRGSDRVEVLTWMKMGGTVGLSEIMGRLVVGTDTSPGGISPRTNPGLRRAIPGACAAFSQSKGSSKGAYRKWGSGLDKLAEGDELLEKDEPPDRELPETVLSSRKISRSFARRWRSNPRKHSRNRPAIKPPAMAAVRWEVLCVISKKNSYKEVEQLTSRKSLRLTCWQKQEQTTRMN